MQKDHFDVAQTADLPESMIPASAPPAQVIASETPRRAPCRRARQPRSARASAALAANGFRRAVLPASSARIVHSQCRAFGSGL